MRIILKIIFIIIIALFFIVIFLGIWFQLDTRVTIPEPTDTSITKLTVTYPEKGFYTCGSGWLQQRNSGLWELYIEGKPFQRGVIEGKLDT